MAAEVPLPSAKPPATDLRCPVRTRHGRPTSCRPASGSQFWRPGSFPCAPNLAVRLRAAQPRCPQLRAVQSRGPSFGVRVRPRAHQTPFCARGHQKNIAVSENAPSAHGIVPRHCSTRAAGMNAVLPRTPAAAAPATQPPPRSLYLDAKSSRARPASSTARSTALSLM